MFIGQAAEQFKLYTGRDAPVDVMRDTPEAQAWTDPRMRQDPAQPPRVWPWWACAGPASRPWGGFWPNDWAGRSRMPIVELAARAGRSIRAIFAELGEPAFRDLEEATLAELTARSPLVLATGGGVVLREVEPRTAAAVRPGGMADRRPRRARRAVAVETPRGLADRPALTPAGTIDELAEVLQSRAPLYRLVADVAVETDGKSTGEVGRCDP